MNPGARFVIAASDRFVIAFNDTLALPDADRFEQPIRATDALTRIGKSTRRGR